MKTEFTPGPWWIEKDIDNRGNPDWRIHSETISDLACLTFMDKEDRDEFGAANAKLIAAAPEMFELLQLIKEACQPDEYLGHCPVDTGWLESVVTQMIERIENITE